MERYSIYWNQEITQDNEIFTSQIEWVDSLVYLHCKVHRNTPGAIRAVKRELSRLLDRFEREGVEIVYAYLEKGRFAAMLGGEYLTEFDEDGKHYEVYSYATSSSSRGGSDCCRSEYIRISETKASSEESWTSSGRSGGHKCCPTEEPGDGSSEAADTSTANSSSTGSAGSCRSWSLSEFW